MYSQAVRVGPGTFGRPVHGPGAARAARRRLFEELTRGRGRGAAREPVLQASSSAAGAGRKRCCWQCGRSAHAPAFTPFGGCIAHRERWNDVPEPGERTGGSEMSTIRVVLADDHGLMRDAVRMVLDGDSDLELVGEVANGRDLLPLVARVRPDFVLLDVQLPGRRRPRLPRVAGGTAPGREGRDALGRRGPSGDRRCVPARGERVHPEERQPVRPARHDPPDRRADGASTRPLESPAAARRRRAQPGCPRRRRRCSPS